MKLAVIGSVACVFLFVLTIQSQVAGYDAAHPPRFEDFPVSDKWNASPAAVKLTNSSERMFKTQLTKAAEQPPTFASHYRVAYWGCGSFCSAGALVDLETGDVFQLPLSKPGGTGWDRWIACAASFEGANDEFHLNSRLMIVRCGMNFSERLKKNIPDTSYFVWENNRFRRLLYVPGKQP